MNIKAKRWAMGIAAIWGVMTGCKPASVGLGPFPAAAPAHPGGLRYSLGRDFVAVEAVVSEYVETRVVSSANKRFKTETRTGRLLKSADVSLQTLADPSFVYSLDFGSRGGGDASLEIRVGDNGLLASVETESRSRAGEILLQVVRAAGDVAGALAGFRSPADFGAESAAPASDEAGAEQAPVGSSGRRERRQEALSPEALFFLQESALAREIRRDLDRLEEELAERRSGLRGYTDAAAGAADAARFSLAEKRADFLEDSIPFLEKQVEKAGTAFTSSLRTFLASHRIGRESRDRTIRRHLDLRDLPTSSGLWEAASDEAITAFLAENFPRSLSLYRETGLVIAFDPSMAMAKDPSPAVETQPKKNEIRIYYRETLPGFLRIFAWEEGADPEKMEFGRSFRLADEKPVAVLHPGLPVRYVKFDRKAFSSRSLRLAVNGQGRVVGLAESSTSTAAAAASGTASALAALRAAFAEAWGDTRSLVEALGKLTSADPAVRLALLRLRTGASTGGESTSELKRTPPEE